MKPVMNQCPCLGERPRLTLEAHRSRSSCGLTVPLAQDKDGDSDGKSVTARRSSTQVMGESKCSKTQSGLAPCGKDDAAAYDEGKGKDDVEVFDEGDAKKDLVAIDWTLAGTSQRMTKYDNGGPGGLTGILAGTKTMAKFRERRTRMNRQPFYGTPGRKKRWEEAFQKFFDANHDFETWSQVAIDETRWTELLPQYVAWRMNRSGLNKLSPGEDPDNIYILKTDFDERDLKNAEPDSKDTEGACDICFHN